MTNYSLQDSGIFYVEFTDAFGLAEAKKYMEEFMTIDYLNSPLLIIYDLRKADLQFAIDDLPSLGALAEKSTANYNVVRAAYLIDDPKITAFGIIFSSLRENLRTTRNIFSTLKAAEDWLIKEV